MRTLLAKRQIATQHRDTYIAKCVGQSDQQRRTAVRTGAVCEHQAVRICGSGFVQKTSHGRFAGKFVYERHAL